MWVKTGLIWVNQALMQHRVNINQYPQLLKTLVCFDPVLFFILLFGYLLKLTYGLVAKCYNYNSYRLGITLKLGEAVFLWCHWAKIRERVGVGRFGKNVGVSPYLPRSKLAPVPLTP